MSTPDHRPIVHDATNLGGRWPLAGSSIAVAEVCLDHAARGSERDYRYPGVSADELARCLDFSFPPVRDATVTIVTGTVAISCACGEETAVSGTLADPVHCVCGRRWRLTLLLQPLEEGGRSAPLGEVVGEASVAL